MDSTLFSKQLEHEQIVDAIRRAEGRTSGEIRVFISNKSVEEPVAAAQRQFEKLGMTKTAQRNGVLIFVAPGSQAYAIIGDAGIHEKCGPPFWEALSAEMKEHFVRSEFTLGITKAVEKAGLLLAEHFPRTADDENELSDDIAHD